MDPHAWQLGLVIGTAVTLVFDWGVRLLLHWLRHRKREHCTHCSGILSDNGRAESPIERLQCCAWCGDTWLEGKRPEYVPPQPGYREPAVDQIQDLLRKLPPAPRKGDSVDIDAAFERLMKPQGPDIELLKEGQLPTRRRAVPGPGMSRMGMAVLTDLDALTEHRNSIVSSARRRPPPDLPSPLPPRKVQE